MTTYFLPESSAIGGIPIMRQVPETTSIKQQSLVEPQVPQARHMSVSLTQRSKYKDYYILLYIELYFHHMEI